MTAKDVLRHVVESCHRVADGYLSDLEDADLLVRAVPGANHIAWQLGHLISAEHRMLSELGHRPPGLPPGFAEAHTNHTAACGDPSKFLNKDDYVAAKAKMKAAVLAAIEATPDSDLGRPGPESMREYAPTVAAALALLGLHWLMHAGQWVPIRRKLGKPPLF